MPAPKMNSASRKIARYHSVNRMPMERRFTGRLLTNHVADTADREDQLGRPSRSTFWRKSRTKASRVFSSISRSKPQTDSISVLPGDNFAGAVHQALKQTVFGARQSYRNSGPGDFARFGVENEIADLQPVLRTGCSAPLHRTQTRQQFTEAERLGEIIVGARVQAAHYVGNRVLSREHQHRGCDSLLTKLLGQFESIHLGQHDVEHDRVKLVGVSEFPAFAAVGSTHHVMALFGEAAAQQFEHAGFIFDDEQFHRVVVPQSCLFARPEDWMKASGLRFRLDNRSVSQSQVLS